MNFSSGNIWLWFIGLLQFFQSTLKFPSASEKTTLRFSHFNCTMFIAAALSPVLIYLVKLDFFSFYDVVEVFFKSNLHLFDLKVLFSKELFWWCFIGKVHIFWEAATNFCEISTLDLSHVVTINSSVEILQNFVTFSEYMNFIQQFQYDLSHNKSQVVFYQNLGKLQKKLHRKSNRWFLYKQFRNTMLE